MLKLFSFNPDQITYRKKIALLTFLTFLALC